MPVDLVLCRPGLTSPAEKKWAEGLPLGIAYLASSARDEGLSVAIVDAKMTGHLQISETVEAILKYKPKFVGISCLTVDFPRAIAIAESLSRVQSPPTVILGGPHINALPEESLQEARSAKYILAGQAEKTLVNLIKRELDNRPVGNISGLYWRENGRIKGNLAQKVSEDLSTLSFPAWDLFPRVKSYPIIAQRGCPYHCVFCGHNLTNHIRSRSVEHVLSEIIWLRETFGARGIGFEDETFGVKRDWTREFLLRLADINANRKLEFWAQTRADSLSIEMAGMMKKAGFSLVSMGVESGDAEVLRRTGKGIDLQQVENAVKIARKAGLRIWLKFIIGLPGETSGTALNTIRFAAKLNPDKFSFATIVPYPGSDIYKWALRGENGYTLITKNWERFSKYTDTSVNLEKLSARQMKGLQILMFVFVYLRNLRFREFARTIVADFPLALSILKSAFR